jgi:ATP-dependent Clp protease ATP-binding subunit ClpC
MASRFEKFSERARRVLTIAQEEARSLNHSYIGTEHILLGLVREEEGVAARVLTNLGIGLSKVRSAVEFIIGRGDKPGTGETGLTPRAKKVIELTKPARWAITISARNISCSVSSAKGKA